MEAKQPDGGAVKSKFSDLVDAHLATWKRAACEPFRSHEDALGSADAELHAILAEAYKPTRQRDRRRLINALATMAAMSRKWMFELCGLTEEETESRIAEMAVTYRQRYAAPGGVPATNAEHTTRLNIWMHHLRNYLFDGGKNLSDVRRGHFVPLVAIECSVWGEDLTSGAERAG